MQTTQRISSAMWRPGLRAALPPGSVLGRERPHPRSASSASATGARRLAREAIGLPERGICALSRMSIRAAWRKREEVSRRKAKAYHRLPASAGRQFDRRGADRNAAASACRVLSWRLWMRASTCIRKRPWRSRWRTRRRCARLTANGAERPCRSGHQGCSSGQVADAVELSGERRRGQSDRDPCAHVPQHAAWKTAVGAARCIRI